MDFRYTAEQARVAKYLNEIAPGIGAGEDPVGFLIASHGALRRRATELTPDELTELNSLIKVLRNTTTWPKSADLLARLLGLP